MSRSATGTTHHVAIVNDHGRYHVVPGHLVAGVGDAIVFHTVGAGPVVLAFPRPILWGSDTTGPVERLPLDPERGGAAEVVVGEASAPGSYTYTAYCADVDDLAVGGSQPKIIIYK